MTAGTSSRRPVKTTRWAIRELASLGLERVAPAALADDQQVGVGHGAQDGRPRLEQRRVALLRLEPGDDADDRAPGSIPYSSRSVQHGSWWS